MKNKYFPQYFREKRPYFNNAFVSAAFEAARNPNVPVVAFIREIILRSALGHGLPDEANRHYFLSREAPIAQTLVTLAWNDTPLYDMSPALLDALARSDPGDMRLADLRSPNHIYFLNWGPQDDLLVNARHPVEGAIVAAFDDHWHVALVARQDESWLSMTARDNFLLKFPPSAYWLPFQRAVDAALDAGLQEIDDVYRASQEGRNDWGMSEVIRDQLQTELQLNTPVLKKALELAGNCIAYLTAYPQDSRFDWEEDAPKAMLEKLTRGGKEAARTASKLKNSGFLQIHRVGLDFQRSVDEAERHHHDAHVGSHLSPRPHWRRGHWRHQAFGPELAERKLLWVRPTRVLGGPAMSNV